MMAHIGNFREIKRLRTNKIWQLLSQRNHILRVVAAIFAVWAVVSSTLTVTAAALPPTITKSFTPSTIPAGTLSTLSFTITNPAGSTVALTGVAVTDGLPAGVVVAAPPNVVGNCNGGTVVATAGSGIVSLSNGTLPLNATCTITMDVTAAAVGTYNNTSGNVTSTNGGIGNTASATLIVVPPVLPPTAAKSFTPASIPLNGTSVMKFTLTNPAANTATLTGIGITDNLPAGVVIGTPPNVVGNCNGGVVTAVAGGTTVSLTGGSLVANTNCVISVNVTAAAQGAYVNTTGAVTSTNGGTGNTATATLTVVAPPVVAKAFAPATMAAGDKSVLTLTFTNPAGNTVAETGMALTDNLPLGLKIASPNGLVSTCGGTATAAVGSASVSLSGSTLAANATCTVKVNVTSPTAGTYMNVTQTVTSTNGGTGNTATDTLTITGTIQPPSIVKAFTPNSIPAGGSSSMTFVITNPAGNAFALTGVAVADTLPAGVIVASPNGLTNTCGGTPTAVAGSNSVTLTNGTVTVSCTITVNVTSTTGNTYVNTTGNVTSINGGTGNTGTDTLTVTGTINPPSIAKAFLPATIAAGATSTLTFTITNSNAALALTGVGVVDTLPAGVVLAVPPNQAGNCGGVVTLTGGNKLTLTGGSIPISGNCVFSVDVTSAVAGAHINTSAAVTSTNGGTGNTAIDTLTVTGTVTAPTITKAFGPNQIPLSGISTLTFTITNPNAGIAMTGVGVVDTYPGIVNATPPSVVGNCNGGTVTAVAGAGTFTLTGGSLAAAANCVITVNVRGTTAGVKNNLSGPVSSTNAGTGNQAADTLTVVAPPTITKAFAPTTIQAGGVSTLSFVITNPAANTVAAAGVAVTDTLPANVVINTPPNVVGTCGGGIVTAVAGGTTITLTGGAIAVAGNCTITVDVFGPIVGVYNNTTGAVSSTNGGTGLTASATLTVTGAIVPPTISKSFTPATILVNTVSTITFTIVNPPANAVSEVGVSVTDNLPAGLIVATPPNIVGNCNGGVVTAAAGGTLISLTGGTIPANGNCVFSVDSTSGLGGVYANTTGSATSTNGGTGGTGSATLVVVAPPSITKAFAPATVAVGGNSTLSLIISNSNLGTFVTGVAVTDPLPAGVVVATPPNVVGNCNGGTVTAVAGGNTIDLAGGDLPASGTCTISVDVTGIAAGVKNNTTGNVTSTNAGTGNTGTATLTVTAILPPSITKAFTPATV
ncbi:MAG: hypothetical protein ABI947_27180, partial [Chloroflexota bacterium]